MANLTELLTFGHGTASAQELAALIRSAGIALVVDVRSVPKSRRLPHVWESEMTKWLPELAGADYIRIAALGGFRKSTPDSKNVALRHASFRAYADYMETPDFQAALDELMRRASKVRTAIMCSESLWWRCHRRLIADAATLLRHAQVRHLMHDGSLRFHVPTESVRISPQGLLRYDAQAS